jgi:pimeloyl-ACP methyl ester carboxylesterase
MQPITLLPGLACDAELWRDQVAALAPLRPVQVSDVHTRGTTLPQMAAALLASRARPDTPELTRLRSDAIALFEQGRMREVLQANVAFAFDPAHAAALAPPYLAMMDRAGAGQLIAQNRAIMARADQRPLLPRIACPTLVVVGQSDLLTPPKHAQEMAALIAGARLETLSQCGHLLTWEQPQRVNQLLIDWLASL